jgi:predicted CXXCH cytochrome family protein
MKKFFAGIAALLVGLAGTTANGQITNSAHDFSSYAWSQGEICKPCHIPHNAAPASVSHALWNHALTNATYIMNGGGTGTATADLDTTSRLCMSCHDGTVALDSFGGMTGNNFIPGSANIGTDLSNDHPIGSVAVYPTGTSTSYNPQNASHQVVSTWGTLRLRSWVNPGGATEYVVGCRTCHDPHNRGNFGHMMQFSNQASRLCLTCHIK